jgi:hypothetical protein
MAIKGARTFNIEFTAGPAAAFFLFLFALVFICLLLV